MADLEVMEVMEAMEAMEAMEDSVGLLADPVTLAAPLYLKMQKRTMMMMIMALKMTRVILISIKENQNAKS